MTPLTTNLPKSAPCGECLQDIFQRNAHRTVIIDARNGDEVTYGRLWNDSLAVASYLQSLGVKKGDPVVFSLENCVELATLYFACLQIGARVVPVNPSYHPHDYAAIVEGISARFFFTSPAIRTRLVDVLGPRPQLQVLCLQPTVEKLKADQATLVNVDLAQVIAQHEPCGSTLADATDNDIAFTMFTSGSTGVPKGINMRLGGLVGNGKLFCEHMNIDSESRFYDVLAMTYLGGLYNLMLIPILAEGSLVLDSVFGPTNVFGFWEQVRQYEINTLWFSPTMLSMLMMLEDDEDLSFLRSQVRLGLVGMAPLPVDLKKRFESRYGFRLFENYGLSETTFLCTDHPSLANKPGSVGKPLEGVSVRILDNDLRPLPAGREGQIGTQTPYLMAGYEKEGDIAASLAKSNGYFLTGDLGYFDADGELFVTGRIKDLIIRGGVNISPKVIENAVYRLDTVQEAAVVGVPHPMYGEEVALVVKLHDAFRQQVTVKDLQGFCDANIAHFMRPKFIFIIDEIPKGATGKIQKNIIKRMLIEKLDPLNG